MELALLCIKCDIDCYYPNYAYTIRILLSLLLTGLCLVCYYSDYAKSVSIRIMLSLLLAGFCLGCFYLDCA